MRFLFLCFLALGLKYHHWVFDQQQALRAELSQTQAAEILGIQQPQVSLLMRNRGGSFSVGRLIELSLLAG